LLGGAANRYDETSAPHVREHYRKMREQQSVEHVQRLRAKYSGPGRLGSVQMAPWDALEQLSRLVRRCSRDVAAI